jgi:hypothetical protein
MQKSGKKSLIIFSITAAFIIAAIILIYLLTFASKRDFQNHPSSIVKTFNQHTEQTQKNNQKIRQAAVAGQFYPADKSELKKMIDDYLNQAKINQLTTAPQIIIVPHAGFVYSGRVAAYAYKTLPNTDFERVILLGRSHTSQFNGIAADTNDFWQTPLGNIKIDQEFIDLLPVIKDSKPHQNEHSLEVQVPFLIKTLGQDIKIAPLLYGDNKKNTIENLAEILGKTIDKKTLIVISTDLSHYPNYEQANKIDKKTIEALLSNDIDKFRNKISELKKTKVPNLQTLICAEPAVQTALILSEKFNLKPQLLKYANSGDYFPNQKDRVVGYAAIAFTGSINSEDINKRGLNAEEQKKALDIAGKTLENYFNQTEYKPNISAYPIFKTKRGAFVTLKINGRLRGCIGDFEPEKTLAEVIQDMALSAAFNDSRFQPLTAEEFKNVDIEISVLSPREKIADHNLIEIGKHGVYVQKGNRAGTYLPQVATENNWTKEKFLKSLCEDKSQIGPNCWLDPKTNLYIFTAQIFHK